MSLRGIEKILESFCAFIVGMDSKSVHQARAVETAVAANRGQHTSVCTWT
jgi:hypothetical protein